MTRPYFLRRLSNRIARNVTGADRKPVKPDYHGDVFIGVLVLLFCVGVASAVLILLLGAPLLNLVCGGI